MTRLDRGHITLYGNFVASKAGVIDVDNYSRDEGRTTIPFLVCWYLACMPVDANFTVVVTVICRIGMSGGV